MIRQVIDYVKNDSFELKIDNKYIDVINYSNINYMTEEKISIAYNEGSILLKGNNLTVIKLLDNEILIKGLLKNIEIRRNNE